MLPACTAREHPRASPACEQPASARRRSSEGDAIFAEQLARGRGRASDEAMKGIAVECVGAELRAAGIRRRIGTSRRSRRLCSRSAGGRRSGRAARGATLRAAPRRGSARADRSAIGWSQRSQSVTRFGNARCSATVSMPPSTPAKAPSRFLFCLGSSLGARKLAGPSVLAPLPRPRSATLRARRRPSRNRRYRKPCRRAPPLRPTAGCRRGTGCPRFRLAGRTAARAALRRGSDSGPPFRWRRWRRE